MRALTNYNGLISSATTRRLAGMGEGEGKGGGGLVSSVISAPNPPTLITRVLPPSPGLPEVSGRAAGEAGLGGELKLRQN